MSGGSIRLRLFFAGALSIIAALALAALGLVLLFERHVERRIESELAVYLDQIIANLDRNADGTLFVADVLADPRFDRPLSGLYWQVQAGDAVLRSRSLWDGDLPLPRDELADGNVHRHRIIGPAGVELLALERSLTLPARLGSVPIRATVAIDAREITTAARAFAADLVPYIGVLAAVLIAAALAQVTFGLSPLANVRKRLAAIREGQATRLGAAFPKEVQPLAAEIDALLEAREREAERARERAADLAHGLKTPLQVLAGDVERLRQKGEADIAADIEQVTTAMRRHVERELARARMKSGVRTARANVREVIDRVLAVVMRTPDAARLTWDVDCPPQLLARIDADDLAEAIGNLLDNAARYARRVVRIEAYAEDKRVKLLISDDGPGIPPERMSEVLARGGRLDEAGAGAGLGLAIVQEIVEAWGGWLQLRSRDSGLQAELALDLVPAR